MCSITSYSKIVLGAPEAGSVCNEVVGKMLILAIRLDPGRLFSERLFGWWRSPTRRQQVPPFIDTLYERHYSVILLQILRRSGYQSYSWANFCDSLGNSA